MPDTYHRGLRIINGSSQLPGDLKHDPPGAREPPRGGRATRTLADPFTATEPDPAPGGSWTIRIPGTPRGKPRMTQRDKWRKRPCVVAYRQWADRVRQHLAGLPMAASVQSLSWTATFEPPRSWSKHRRLAAIGTLHRAKPDRDNLDKAVLDILYPAGDQAIAQGMIEKRWGWQASLEIRIEAL